MKKILFVNHDLSDHCGVYQYGKLTGDILRKSKKYEFIYCETRRLSGVAEFVKEHQPAVCFYNAHPMVMPWQTGVKRIPGPAHIGLYHDAVAEITSKGLPNEYMDCWISINPATPLSAGWFKIGRPLPEVDVSDVERSERMTFSSFGIAFQQKMFVQTAIRIGREWPGSKFRVHVLASFLDKNSDEQIRDHVLRMLEEDGPKNIEYEVTTGIKPIPELVRWLAQSHANILAYAPVKGAGPSSALDFCIAAGQPILCSESSQFDHVDLPKLPSKGISDALTAGTLPVLRYKNLWTQDALIADYERIIDQVTGA